ncbi:MAG: cytochrome c biogenesis protein CcsA [Actinomycetota bacterium]|nr:cytochrome c biogenesis protein CcsA [Actinomycetota bacterium]
MAELLFVVSLLAYAEGAVAYAAEARRPGLAGRLAIWGVRVGWLTQTALLVAQVVRADAFPWSSWAGSLNLFVWLVVGTYLIWGCRARFRLLGLVVMPLAAVLFALSGFAGGTSGGGDTRYSTLFLVLHVGLVLAAFAGFTLAAALSALYLWQERRLKRHAATILRLRVPSLVTLDELAARTIAIALPALTLGIVTGAVRLASTDRSVDALIAVTLLAWLVYAAFLFLRYEAGWRGRRAAYLTLVGFALVLAVRVGLPTTHFASG